MSRFLVLNLLYRGLAASMTSTPPRGLSTHVAVCRTVPVGQGV